MSKDYSPIIRRSPLSLVIGAMLFLILPVTGGNENGGSSGRDKINNGKRVPKMKKDKKTKDFLKNRIAEDALLKHNKNVATSLENYDAYANNLATILSQLTEEEQQEVFYGGGG